MTSCSEHNSADSTDASTISTCLKQHSHTTAVSPSNQTADSSHSYCHQPLLDERDVFSTALDCDDGDDEVGTVPAPWIDHFTPARVVDYSDCDDGDDATVRRRFELDALQCRRPLVVRGLRVGACMSLWSGEYLAERVGPREVTAHVSTASCLQYAPVANYRLRRLPFDELVRRCQRRRQPHGAFFDAADERYYLRALDDEADAGGARRAAQLWRQFPQLADDWTMPRLWPTDPHAAAERQPFSTVLRVSSASVRLWAHYDVMDNVLVQVAGRKRVLLFAPAHADKLHLRGAKCAPADLERADLGRFRRLSSARPVVAHLRPGDAVFIPALWFHSVTAHDFSVAVNVFWHHLPAGCYQSSDVFGNKDPLAAAQALTTLKRAMQHLNSLPTEYRDFYGRRMICDIENTLLIGGEEQEASNHEKDDSERFSKLSIQQ